MGRGVTVPDRLTQPGRREIFLVGRNPAYRKSEPAATADAAMGHVFAKTPDLEVLLASLFRQIPPGCVATCGALAGALGNPIAARWVGHFLRNHEHGEDCPCHRVVRADGHLGAYIAGSLHDKARRLRREGVKVGRDRVDVTVYAFDRFVSDRPLDKLRRLQEELAAQVRLRGPRKPPKLVGGVDVSYPTTKEGVAAYTLVELDGGRCIWSTTIRRPITFPYITTYLAFREIPILLELIEAVRAEGRLAELLLVDGSGILHHRHAGIAAHLGVITGTPTVGVTKTLLVGKVDIEGMAPGESRPVYHQGQAIGAAIRATSKSRRPIFVSPGHRVTLAMAESVVHRLLQGRRLPEPLYWADRLSRAEGHK